MSIVEDLEHPPSETVLFTLKPVVVPGQIFIVAAIESGIKAWRFSGALFTVFWILGTASFFVFDDLPNDWFLVAPFSLGFAVSMTAA